VVFRGTKRGGHMLGRQKRSKDRTSNQGSGCVGPRRIGGAEQVAVRISHWHSNEGLLKGGGTSGCRCNVVGSNQSRPESSVRKIEKK